MLTSQKLALRLSEIRRRLAELAGADEALTDEQRGEIGELRSEMQDVELRYQAAVEAEGEPESRTTGTGDGEGAELDAIRAEVRMSEYVSAALDGRPVGGREAEFNAALQIPSGRFPLELLAPEVRATTNADGQANQGRWIDRLFADTAAMALGITFESVNPGIAAFPVTTAGASAAQRGRTEAAADATWTVAVREIKPSRNAVRVVFSEEDDVRLPGLEPALRRDLSMALAEGVDRACFLGDAGANENAADIAGLTTASGVIEKELTQANKAKYEKILEAFVSLVDGIHATEIGQLAVCASVGSNTLWHGTVANSSAENQTVAQFLRESGLMWTVRGSIEDATANGDWGAFVGRQRGIGGAGIAAIWNSGKLIRDEYSKSATGEVALTLATYWGLAFPRAANFARLKYVT